MTDDSRALVPIEEKQVDFYGDELTAVLVQEGAEQKIYVPLRPIVEFMGLDWSAQTRRIQRDPILSDVSKSVAITATDIDPSSRRPRTSEMLSLQLKYLPGFLFGISANRVKDELRDRVLRYQRECYDVLWEAFQEGRLTAGESFDELLQVADPELVQAYHVAQAVVRLARNQIMLEARLTGRIDDHERRLEDIEMTLGDPDRVITPKQATHLSQAVKAIAVQLSAKTGRNEFGGVWGEFYRRFEIPTYRELPARRFEEAMVWFTEWWQQIAGSSDVPF